MTQNEQIVACENRLLAAMKMSDIGVLEELLDDKLIFNIPSGQTITKSMDLENYKLGIMSVTEIKATDQIIICFDTISTVAVTLYLKGKYGENIIDGKFRYLRVWKLVDTSWKVIAGSGFPI